MARSSLGVEDETRREVNKLKYERGDSTVDETVRYLLKEVRR